MPAENKSLLENDRRAVETIGNLSENSESISTVENFKSNQHTALDGPSSDLPTLEELKIGVSAKAVSDRRSSVSSVSNRRGSVNIVESDLSNTFPSTRRGSLKASSSDFAFQQLKMRKSSDVQGMLCIEFFCTTV